MSTAGLSEKLKVPEQTIYRDLKALALEFEKIIGNLDELIKQRITLWNYRIIESFEMIKNNFKSCIEKENMLIRWIEMSMKQNQDDQPSKDFAPCNIPIPGLIVNESDNDDENTDTQIGFEKDTATSVD